MNINKISHSFLPKQNNKTTKKENNTNEQKIHHPINKKRVGAAVLAGLMLASINAAGKPSVATAETKYTGKSYIDTINPEEISYSIQPLTGNYIEQTDFSTQFLPVAEFYFPSAPEEVVLNLNENVPQNTNGNVIFDITNSPSAEMGEAATIGEIVDKTYSDALAKYDEETQGNVRNKIIDEIIQANPEVADYIMSQPPSAIDAYNEIENITLAPSGIEFITIPNVVVYQSQEVEKGNLTFSQQTYTHKPERETASVVGSSNYLLEGEYASLPDLIYGVYGDDLSTEAYRDILYAVVNAPENAEYFENVINKMNINEIMQSGNITDLNRTLEENTSGVMLNLTMPTVKTTKIIPNGYNQVNGDKEDIIYQISPAKVGSATEERNIELTSKGRSQKVSGDLYDLVDVLQFYSSPDGNGRFAEIDRNGWLILNDDINYFTPFATQIMQQVVYANLDIFTAPYEDENGVHPYGVFDVNNGYDVEGKSLEEIIENSTINIDRMNDFSFIDENGQCLFEDGTTLNLPQFIYRINYCEKGNETSVVTPPSTEPPTPPPTEPPCDPPPTVPPETEEPPTITPPPPTDCPPPPPNIGPEEPIPPATNIPVEEPEETPEPSCPTNPPSVPPETEAPPIIEETPAPSCPTNPPSVPTETEEPPTIEETPPSSSTQQPSCPTNPPSVPTETEEPPTIVHTPAPAETQEPSCSTTPPAEDVEVEEPPTL